MPLTFNYKLVRLNYLPHILNTRFQNGDFFKFDFPKIADFGQLSLKVISLKKTACFSKEISKFIHINTLLYDK